MNKSFLFVFLIVVIYSGCKKADSVFSGAKVHVLTNFVGGYIDTYTYNANDGRVSVIDHNTGDKTIYTYSGDTVLMQYIIGGTVTSSATKYILNGQYADTSVGLYQAQHIATKYSFDGNGQLTEQKNYSYGNLASTVNYTLTNKDATCVTTTNASNGTHTSVYYSYSTNSNSIGNQDFGMPFLGEGNVHLPTTKVLIGVNNDTTNIITYKYRYNTSSFVDTLVSYDRSGTLVDSIAYTYY